MKIVINEVLAGRFQVISLLGEAQFSKAIEVIDLTSSSQKQRYCIKMILNNKDYMDQALDEIKILKLISNCLIIESLITFQDVISPLIKFKLFLLIVLKKFPNLN